MKSSIAGAEESGGRVEEVEDGGSGGIDGEGVGFDGVCEEEEVVPVGGKYVNERENVLRNAPNEKKSTAGAADTLDAAGLVLPSSTEIFDRPFFNEGGKKDTELVFDLGSSESPLVVRAGSASVEGSVGSTVVDGLDILNTSPGPLPPPRTRSGAGATGTFCLGAGNIDNSDDLPAPESKRGFFAGGLSSSSSSPGREGSPIVIFFGPRFDFCAGFEFEGGGRLIGECSLSDSLSLP